MALRDKRCHLHRGKPGGPVKPPPRKRPGQSAAAPSATSRRELRTAVAAPPPRATGRRPSRPAATRRLPGDRNRSERQSRLEEVIRGGTDVFQNGVREAIAARAEEHVAAATWQALVRGRRDGHGCAEIAALAKAILTGEERLQGLAGRLLDGLLAALGRSRVERAFARDLARGLALPWDLKLAATARGLQIAGVYVCLTDNRSLANCACLLDLMETEGTAAIRQLLSAATEDWSGLPARMGDDAG